MTLAPYNGKIYRQRIRQDPRMTLASYNGRIYRQRIRRDPRMTFAPYIGKLYHLRIRRDPRMTFAPNNERKSPEPGSRYNFYNKCNTNLKREVGRIF